MLFEVWLQLSNSAGERQISGVSTALTNNLGGQPGECVSFVGIFGSEPG
jgi:acetyl-CoA C-acetyltransferase